LTFSYFSQALFPSTYSAKQTSDSTFNQESRMQPAYYAKTVNTVNV